jgi:uncharacterized MAPEG superfamily protein
MLLVLISLAVIMFLPLMLAIGSIRFRVIQFGKPDLENPRIQASQLSGAGQRIIAAQHNAWEALALYITALTICTLAGLTLDAIIYPSLLFVCARFTHAIFYIAGIGTLRFFSFLTSIVALSWILILAFQAV